MIVRFQNTLQDLLDLGAKTYCELGPGDGEIAIALKEKQQDVIAIEAPWDFEERTAWGRENDIEVFPGEFFDSDFQEVLKGKTVNCFSLIHSIAHFRFPPQILFEKIYKSLEPDGYFYLSTVNGGSLDRVLKLLRGGALTEKVEKYVDMGEMFRKYVNPSGQYMIWDSWMHVKEYRDFELKDMFQECGFEVVKLFHRNNYSHWKTNIIHTFWPHLSEEIIIIGQKK